MVENEKVRRKKQKDDFSTILGKNLPNVDLATILHLSRPSEEISASLFYHSLLFYLAESIISKEIMGLEAGVCRA